MALQISYFHVAGQHVELKADGSIELNLPDGKAVYIDYPQARTLKKLILAEAEIEKK